MKEVIFENPTAWEAVIGILLLYFVLMVVPFIARFFDAKFNKSFKTPKSKCLMIHIVYASLLTAIIALFTSGWFVYSIDYLLERKVKIDYRIDEILIINHGNEIDYNGKRLFLASNIDLKTLNEVVTNKLCQIEYYEKSGMVILIRVLE